MRKRSAAAKATGASLEDLDELPDDAYTVSSDEDAQPDTRRPTKQQGAYPKKAIYTSRKLYDPNIASSSSGVDQPVSRHQALTRALRLAPSTNTPNLNVWLDPLPNLSLKSSEEVVSKILAIEHNKLRPLGELSDMSGRHFKYSIDSAVSEINWDPQPGDERALKVASIHVNNFQRHHGTGERHCESGRR